MTDNKLQTVRRLLALAEHPGTSAEEAEAANRKAAELIAQYGIDQALLAQAGEIKDTITSRKFTIAEPYSRDRAALLHFVSSALRCQSTSITSGRSKKVVSATVVGYESDLERVAILFPSLLIQADRQLVHARPDRYSGENVRTFRISWWQGFRTAVWRRLTAAEGQAAEASERNANPGTALILADRKTQVAVFTKSLFPKTTPIRKRKAKGTGYWDGHQAGTKADLGGPKLTTEAQQRLRRA
jgi:hypothetical protein